jgi:Transposase DDE domain group 1
MATQSATHRYHFATQTGLALEAAFDGGRLTSDGGLPWLAEADAVLGLCAQLAASLPERRTRHIRYSLESLVRQRVFQIACGYEDQNDADSLRDDPLLKLVCGRLPESGPALAGQSTFSRLENSVDRQACRYLAHALLDVYLAAREQDGVPRHILLDIDSTDDPTHGHQEGTAYHGYYRQHQYYPLLVFDGETDQLITAILRPGTVHGSRGVISVLRVLVQAFQQRWPGVQIEIRGDAAGATPRIYHFCERHQITYTLGLGTNARLAALAAPLLAQAQTQREATGAEKVRLCGETTYQADSWDHARRVVYKTEALAKGPNVRFVVTSRTDAPTDLYDWYVDRGTPELWIKDVKLACFADRLSDHRFWANQCRLFLHAAAYWLLDTLRRWLHARGLPHLQLDTLRLQLIKIGARVREGLHHIRLHLASSHPGQALWALLAIAPPGHAQPPR